MLEIKYAPLANLIPYARNSRTHSDEQVGQIAASIKEFGFTNPVLIDADGGIIAGHGRVRAAHALKLDNVPTIKLGHLTPTQRKAYVIADNRLALNAGWDTSMLTLELKELKDDEFNLGLLGFGDDELMSLLNPDQPGTEGLTDPDDVPENVETRCKSGDLWVLGGHRLLCGDSTNVQHVERLMGGEKADMVFTDPPYGMNAVSNSGVLKERYGTDIMGDDNITAAADSYRLAAGLGVPKLVFWGANYYASKLPDSACWLVWDKNNGGSDQMDCELAWTNLKGVTRQFTLASEKKNRVHPTQKPVALAEWCFGRWEAGDVIDLFLGSGSTLIACEKTGRRCFGMEIDPKYCDVILTRWEQFTGKQATLEAHVA